MVHTTKPAISTPAAFGPEEARSPSLSDIGAVAKGVLLSTVMPSATTVKCDRKHNLELSVTSVHKLAHECKMKLQALCINSLGRDLRHRVGDLLPIVALVLQR